MKRNRIFIALLLLVAILALSACKNELKVQEGTNNSVENGKTPDVYSDTLRVIVNSDVSQFSPYITNTFTDIMALYQIYERLVYYVDGEVVPGLAESWESSEDKKSITFHLRPETTFHNGEPCTSEDVVYSLNKSLERPNQAANRAKYTSIEALDELTVKVDLLYPQESIFSSLSSPGMSIISKDYVEEKGDDAFLEPVGTGAYRLDEWKEGSQISMVAYEDYSDEVPIKNLIFEVISNSSTALVSLETGNGDFMISIPESDFQLVEENKDLVLQTTPSHSTTKLVLNIRNGYLTDENLRKAIAYATDRESIRIVANEGTGTLATGSFDDFLYYSGKDYSYSFDLDKAKEYMALSSYPDGGIELTIKTSDVYGNVVPQMIQTNLSELGISLKIESLEMSAHSQDYLNGNFEIIYAGGSSILPDLAEGLYSSYYYPSNSWSYSTPGDDRFNALLDNIRIETDSDKKTALCDEMMEEIFELCNEIPLITKDANIVFKKGLKNTYVDPNGMFYCFKDFSW